MPFRNYSLLRLQILRRNAPIFLSVNYHSHVHLDNNLDLNPQKVLERDIKVLILKSEEYADRIKTANQKQLQCVGGNAVNETKFYPKYVECVNIGVTTTGKVNWLCKAYDIDKRFKITSSYVSFERLEGSNSLWVREGSAILKYKFEHNQTNEYNKFVILIVIIGTLFITTYLYNSESISAVIEDE